MLTQEQIAAIAAQSILPGLTYAVERCLEELNSARRSLGLSEVQIAPAPAAGGGRKPPARQVSNPEIHEMPPVKRRGRPVGSTNRAGGQAGFMSGANTERWRLIREAGLKSKTMPSNELVAKAKRILDRRAKKLSADAAAV